MEHHFGFGNALAGCWLIAGGLFLSLGVFNPKYRGTRGKRSNGPRMTAGEQLLVSLCFIGFGIQAIVAAFR